MIMSDYFLVMMLIKNTAENVKFSGTKSTL